jgi:hypothetical protein
MPHLVNRLPKPIVNQTISVAAEESSLNAKKFRSVEKICGPAAAAIRDLPNSNRD